MYQRRERRKSPRKNQRHDSQADADHFREATHRLSSWTFADQALQDGRRHDWPFRVGDDRQCRQGYVRRAVEVDGLQAMSAAAERLAFANFVLILDGRPSARYA